MLMSENLNVLLKEASENWNLQHNTSNGVTFCDLKINDTGFNYSWMLCLHVGWDLFHLDGWTMSWLVVVS